MRDFVIVFFLVGYAAIVGRNSISRAKDVIALPPPEQSARTSVEEALARRRSVREYSSKHLTDQQLGQLCWAAQGITHPDGLRAAQSAGALHPLEIYVVTPSGFSHYP
jgi:hypothetical protein